MHTTRININHTTPSLVYPNSEQTPRNHGPAKENTRAPLDLHQIYNIPTLFLVEGGKLQSKKKKLPHG